MKRIFSESFISPRWVDSSTVSYRFPITSTGNEAIPTRTRKDGYRSKPIKLSANSIEIIGSYRNATNKSGILVIYTWLGPKTIVQKDGTASNVQLSTVGNMYFGEFQAGPASVNGTSFKSSYTFDESIDFIQIYTTMDLTALTISEIEITEKTTAVSILSPEAVSNDVTIEDDFELTEVSVPVLIEDPFSIGPDADPFVTIAPASGTYSEPVLVQISVTTPSAVYYTTDGTTPTSSSLVYTAPFYVFSNVTITALAVPQNGTTPEVASATYSVLYTPAISPASGVYADSVDVTITASTTATQSVAQPLRTMRAAAAAPATIKYTTDTRPPSTDSPTYTGSLKVTSNTVVQAVAVTSGVVSAPVSANYTIIVAPTIYPASGTYQAPLTVVLSDVNALANIHYTIDGTTPTTSSPTYSTPLVLNASTTIQCLAAIDGVASSVVSASYVLPTTAPTISPDAGVYEFTQPITITAEDNATIYYTLDGTTPTTASTLYSTPITLDHSAKVSAIAVYGTNASVAATKIYEIVYPNPTQSLSTLYYDATAQQYLWKSKSLASPTFSLASGTYGSNQTLTLTADSTATIYYTIDGSVPSALSTKYTSSIAITTNVVVKAIAIAGTTSSSVSSGTFVVYHMPTISSVSPTSFNEGIAYSDVVITGSNLMTSSVVTIGGVTCTVVSAASDSTSLVASLPSNQLWAPSNVVAHVNVQVQNGAQVSTATTASTVTVIPKWLVGTVNIGDVPYSTIGNPAFGVRANGNGKPSLLTLSPVGGIYVKTPYKWWAYSTSYGGGSWQTVVGWDTTMANIWYCGTGANSMWGTTPTRLTDNTNNADTLVSSMCFDLNSNFYWSLPDGLYKGTPSSATAFTWAKIATYSTTGPFDTLCCSPDGNLYGIQVGSSYDYSSVYKVTPAGTITKQSTLPSAPCVGYKLGCNPSNGYLYTLPNYCSSNLPILFSKDSGITWSDTGSGGLGLYTQVNGSPTIGDGALFFVATSCTYRAELTDAGTITNIVKISSTAISSQFNVAYEFNVKPTLYITKNEEGAPNVYTLVRQF